MKKLLALLLAVIMIVGIFAGCSNNSSNKDAELKVATDFEPPTLDMHNTVDDATIKILLLITEGLVRNKGGKIVPGIAESWDISSDGYEYTFHLRKSKWSDGTALTANDFVYSFLRMVDPNEAYQQAEQAYDLIENAKEYHTGEITDASKVGVKALDDYTLYIKAAVPSSEILNSLATFRWLPIQKSVAEREGMAYGTEADKVSCNGPYKIVSWAHEDKIVLEKNTEYWDAKNIKLKTITCVLNAIHQTAADMCLSGDLDVMVTGTPEERDQLIEAGFKCISYTSTINCLLTNGENSGLNKFFENANFMMAINYAINRKALTEALLPGTIPASRITPPSTMGVNKAFVEEYPFEAWPVEGDPAKAKECLDKALKELNCTVADVPEIVVLCYESEKNLLIIQAIQDMLDKTLGLKMGIDQLPIQAMFGKVFSGDFDLWWSGMPVGSSDWGSPDGFLGDLDWRSPDYTGNWKSEEFARLFDIVRTTSDVKERKDSLFEIEKILCGEHPPFFFITYQQEYVLFRDTFTDPLISQYEDITYMELK